MLHPAPGKPHPWMHMQPRSGGDELDG